LGPRLAFRKNLLHTNRTGGVAFHHCICQLCFNLDKQFKTVKTRTGPERCRGNFQILPRARELVRLTNDIFGIQNLTICAKNYIWLIYNFFYLYLENKTTPIWLMLFFEFLWLMRHLVPMISRCWWCQDFEIEAKLFRLDLVNAMIVRDEQTVRWFWFFYNFIQFRFSSTIWGLGCWGQVEQISLLMAGSAWT
jgi:hypothetical protein